MEQAAERIRLFNEQLTLSKLLLQALRHYKGEVVDRDIQEHGPLSADAFDFSSRVWTIWQDSGLSIEKLFPKMALSNRVTRESDGAADVEKQYSTSPVIGGWYVSRNLLLDRASRIFREIRPDDCAYALALIEEFCTSIKNNHSISPFEATVFISVMQSFVCDANNKVVLHPGPLLLLCKLIVSREPANTAYAMANWLNILPRDEYFRVINGEYVDLHPDQRVLSLGSRIARIVSFPLMPEQGIWRMEGWNTQMLNIHAPEAQVAGAASSHGLPHAPIPPFPVFKDTRKSGGTSIVGIEEINQVLDRIPAGAGVSKLPVDEGLVDLRPLARYIAQLLDAPQRNNNYRRHSNNAINTNNSHAHKKAA